MDGQGCAEQEQLLRFLKKLKEVFDVCDQDAAGYIRVEHFVHLGLRFGQGDEGCLANCALQPGVSWSPAGADDSCTLRSGSACGRSPPPDSCCPAPLLSVWSLGDRWAEESVESVSSALPCPAESRSTEAGLRCGARRPLVLLSSLREEGGRAGLSESCVKKLTKYLDPQALGRINFKDFCHGVFAIKGCEEILKNALGARSVDCRPCEMDNGYYYQRAEEGLGQPIVVCPQPYPDCELFPDEDGMTLAQRDAHESDMDSAIESTPGSELLEGGRPEDKEEGLGGLFLAADKSARLNPSVTSDLSARSSASLISNEEQFEDYGEGEDVDYTPSSPCPDDETRTNGYSDLGSSVSSSAGQTPRKVRHLYNSELLDIYCSQCCKKVNLLNDLEARLKNLKANSSFSVRNSDTSCCNGDLYRVQGVFSAPVQAGPNRKISSTAFGRQLFHNSNFSSSNGSTEDLFRDSIDSCDNDITEKVSHLEKKVTELENDSLVSGDLKSKLKQENTQLVHRVHELEEQIKDQEARAEQTLEEELKRHREAYSKMEREKSTEIELLSSRVQQLEEENTEMKVNVSRLKSQTERLDEERQRMTDKLEDTSLRLKDEMDLYRKVMDKLRQNRHEFQKEKEAMQELIEDLRRELEHLQLFKLEAEKPGRGRSSSSSLSEFTAKTREMELEHEVKRLKQRLISQETPSELQQLVRTGVQLLPGWLENQKLRDQNDDLNGQILSLSLYEAKNLFATQTKAQSLAAEIDNASRDELMEALKEQEEINFRLRQYMDKIILAILDHNPSILEIKH
ncbi:RFP4A protein, partial [Atractosteus spatula]|nr:RFP4A protein [Atractosteus spatula]